MVCFFHLYAAAWHQYQIFKLAKGKQCTHVYLFLHAKWPFTAPFVLCLSISIATAFHVVALKFIPSPASALCSMRKATSVLSSSAVQWLVVHASGCGSGSTRTSGAVSFPSLDFCLAFTLDDVGIVLVAIRARGGGMCKGYRAEEHNTK